MTTKSGLKILIARLSHIGDCVLTLPVVCALRTHFPSAEIVWVVERPTDQLLVHHPAIDELVVLPRGWLKQPREVLRLRRRLRSIEADVCVDPQSLTKSSIAGWLSGAARRIGFRRPIGREVAPVLNTELVTPLREHLVDRSLELLQTMGVESPPVEFGLPVDATAEEKIDIFCRQTHLGCGFALINPGAGWISKQWSPRRFGAVARYLGQTYQLPSVIAWSGPTEKQMAKTIRELSGGHAVLAPPTDLRELVSLLRKAQCYIGGDTGPMHMAAAVGTPCVALFGPTRPSKCGAYGQGHIHVQAFYQDTRRKTGTEAMNAIEVEMVIRACDKMLDRLGQPRVDAHAA